MSKHRKRSARRFGAVAAATAVVAGSALFAVPAFAADSAADSSKDYVPAIITDAGYEGVPFRIFNTKYHPSKGSFTGSIKLNEGYAGFLNFNHCTMLEIKVAKDGTREITNAVLNGAIYISNKQTDHEEDDEEYEVEDSEKEYGFRCVIESSLDTHGLKYTFARKSGELPVTFNPFLPGHEVKQDASYKGEISFPDVPNGCVEKEPGNYECSGNETKLNHKFEVSPDAVNFAVPIHAGANFDNYNWTVSSPGEQKPDCSSVELEKRDNGDQYLKFSCKPSLIGKQIVVRANGFYPQTIDVVNPTSAYVIEDGDGTQVGAGTFEKEYQGNIEVVKPAAGNSVTKVFKLWNTADKTGTPQTKTATFTFVDKEGEKPVNPGEPVKTENPGGGKGSVTPTAKPSTPAEKSSHQPALAQTGATEAFGLAIGGTLMLLAGAWLVRRQRRVES